MHGHNHPAHSAGGEPDSKGPVSGLGSSGIKLRAFWSPEVKYLWLDFAAALNLGLLPQINSTWGDISTLRATLTIWVTPGQDKHESDVPRWSGAAHREGWSGAVWGSFAAVCPQGTQLGPRRMGTGLVGWTRTVCLFHRVIMKIR